MLRCKVRKEIKVTTQSAVGTGHMESGRYKGHSEKEGDSSVEGKAYTKGLYPSY